jgi:putative colanic acid biosysnthesis UDP-glucose lipid carrier transferase
MSHVAFSSEEVVRPAGAARGLAALLRGGLEKLLAFAILVGASPLMLAAAIAIRMDAAGPVLFRQDRHGLGGRIIRIYKFRTMHVVEPGCSAQQAMPGDTRVTRVGRFLRATSIDELPQLLNVLAGDMALVGPRPHPIALDKQFSPLIGGYMARYNVKPGITGLAQVKGLRGPTSDIETMQRRVAADMDYVRHRSVVLDAWILASTLPAVLGARNAL